MPTHSNVPSIMTNEIQQTPLKIFISYSVPRRF